MGATYRLGLSATLVREDGKIEELQESVGRLLFKTKSACRRASAAFNEPSSGGSGAGGASSGSDSNSGASYLLARQSDLKLTLKPATGDTQYGYGGSGDAVPGVSVQELQEQGFLPRMSYIHVKCDMLNTEWSILYHKGQGQQKQRLATLNPTKMMMLQFLLHYHFEMGDKVLIFCDGKSSLQYLARHLQLPYMDGSTPPKEREALLYLFKGGTGTQLTAEEQRWCSVLMLSRVGDKGIDLPDANVLIQVRPTSRACSPRKCSE